MHITHAGNLARPGFRLCQFRCLSIESPDTGSQYRMGRRLSPPDVGTSRQPLSREGASRRVDHR